MKKENNKYIDSLYGRTLKMSKFESLQSDMIAAMKAKDKPRKDAISSLIQAIKKVAIDEGHRDDIADDFADRIILKELKNTKEQVDTCPDSRAELKAEYQLKYDIMSEYAPQLMSADEIRTVLTDKFAEVIATKNKGMIMKTVMADLKGKADGKDISRIVEELCK